MKGRVTATLLVVLLCVLGPVPVAQAEPPSAQIDVGGLQRTYYLHLPPRPPTGLVVNMHAAGQNGRQHAALTHYDTVADAHGYAVVYPDGIDLSWADGRGASVPDRTGVDDVGFIVALVDRLTAELGIPAGRVFATGLSAGGFMANRLACDRADMFAAIAPIGATLGDQVACNPSQPVSVLTSQGTVDPIVPFNGGPMIGRGGPSTILAAYAVVDRWRELNGCAPDPVIAPVLGSGDGTSAERVSYECAAGTEVVFLRVDGGGHTWPGAPEILPADQVGPATRAFDASEVSAQFFDAHGR
ncbi:extracellular catalytic domain type 1 short-chain-length polyhydroxyalkanoate depolymerase [Mycolicibacterium frederiksbergense]|uniref:extracellular catalytic domain type 1 short-chain-length polyhydroxyalkanoate depolymerase n=1 Tax=Mycolicibacterium frederiksbergense TaxID=117567 RepID=UPI00399A0DFF